ncbi:hypothetical protein [Dyadobacter sandarakinus]|uniref:Uncharacterized protein n=1 Tax=Dyadobacter sandarakinus TaxID=2747268 RepID=A0ABX7I3W9_9BACT|nr:hypothetical protein [Dyadobacter sandarakinus]QRR00759.1 hypothetical protein HWI92_07490 [Dyadobacter sandarakinus]
MKTDANIQYAIGIACKPILAFITLLNYEFDLNYIALIFALGTCMAAGGIFLPGFRQQYANLMIACILMYIGLFSFVLTKSPEISFEKFKDDTFYCFVIVTVSNGCLFAFRLFRPNLKLSIERVSRIYTLVSTILIFLMAFTIVYFYNRFVHGSGF